jgi:hypothetical protein
MLRIALVGIVILNGLAGWAQDSVTIPKARLEELERKEAELKKLKGEFEKTQGENTQLKQQQQQNAVQAAAAARPVHVTPALATLPALQPGEVVEAIDLSNHYRNDPTAAQQRYHKRTFKVKGEIVGFDMVPFVRFYKVRFRTAEPQTSVVCEVSRSEKYSAVFTTEHGNQLVGLLSGTTRVPLARVGDTAVVEARCNGGDKSVVTLSRGDLKSITPLAR